MKAGKIDSGLVNDLYEVIYDSGEITEAITSITISNLDGNVAEEYELICRFVDDDTTGGYYLRFNNDSGNNYGYQEIDGTSSTVSAARDTSEAQIDLGYTNTDSNICFSHHLIYAKSGYIRTVLSSSAEDISGTTVTSINLKGQVWNNTADNITSIVIGALNDKLNIGSRIILMKKIKLTSGLKTGDLNIQGKIKNTWQKIYETTLESATTSVTISSLDGNTDVLYRIKIRIVDGNSGTAPGIRFNNDSGNNYGRQNLSGGESTASAGRNTGVALIVLGNTNSSGEIIFMQGIFYIKSGYIRTGISTDMNRVTGTYINPIRALGQVWNNTADNVTSIVVFSDQTNGLGIGTYICIERLNI